MALTSVFYDGPVTETDRAQNRTGAPDYGVYGADDFKVSAHPSIPYALVVKAGKAHGWGVTDTATTDQTVQCDTLSGTGAVRFDLITVNRNWQPLLGGPSTLKAISGGATMPDINTIRKIGPGVEDDQPIALVEWRGGVNTPYRITDLRCWAGNGGMVAADMLALNYLGRPGANVLIGSTTWRFALGANNVWGWVETQKTDVKSAPIAGLAKPDWAPMRTFTGIVDVSSGAGGENRGAAGATDAAGVGAFWLGYNGVPNFSGIYSVQLTGYHPLPQFLHVPALLAMSTTRVKFKSRRIDNTGWANGYGSISMSVTIVGW